MEEHEPIGPARERLVAAEPHQTRVLRHVAPPPVDGIRRLLHHEPRRAAFERSHQVRAGSAFERARVRLGGIGIEIVRREIDVLGPAPVVARLEETHEVRRDRNPWRQALENLALYDEELEQRVGTKALPVELL